MENDTKTAPKTEDSGLKVYELGYLLVSGIPEEKVKTEVEAIVSLITKNNGVVVSSEDPIFIDLAYPIRKVIQTNRQKHTKGYFGWVKFEMSPDMIAEVKKALDLSPTMLRYLITKTVKENTLLHGHMVLHKEEMPADLAVEVEEEVVGDIEVEEKPVDDLVVA
jgi:ribosomal protein S6